MIPPTLAAERAAMEVLEAALELPDAERFSYIARMAKPIGIRQLALRLLPLTYQTDLRLAVRDPQMSDLRLSDPL